MDASGGPLPDSINPNNFPAKLWRLVSNPAYKAICWDSRGEVIVIDQHLFEKQILSPSTVLPDNADAFKTTNFSSFVRQLNLYGFRKAEPPKDIQQSLGESRTYHHFYNPNFKRNHPELVARLRRLTVDNKAKLQAGLNVSCRPPSRWQRLSGGDAGSDKNMKRVSAGTSSLLSPSHQESIHPYYSTKAQAMAVHNGTPVPPRYLIRRHGAALSPAVFATDKGMPLSLSHHYAAVASNSNAVHIQQGLLSHANHGNQNFPTFNPPNAQYQPGYYSPVFQRYQPNLVASHLTGSGLQTGPYSPHSYYQARYPVNLLCRGHHNQDPQNKDHQEMKKCEINLDTVFQIADEVMQTPANSCLVKIVTPEKPGHTRDSMLCDDPVSSVSKLQAAPLCAGPIIMAVSGNADLSTYIEQEESVLSIPEQMPEDAIEVTNDDAKDPEVLLVDVSNTPRVTSQAYKSSCDRSPN